MLKQLRSTHADQQSASTPDIWADLFSDSTVMTEPRARRMQHEPEWKLIQNHIAGGSTVLDAGCGFGEWIYVLDHAGYKGIGVDYSDALIARLRATYPDGSWIHSTIQKIPLPEGAVDAVISWGVIEHDEAGPAAALREFHRVVRPSGTVVVSVPHDSKPQRDASQVLFPPGKHMAFFQYAMTSDELAGSLREAGFEVVQIGTIPGATLALAAPRLCLYLRSLGRLGSILERIFSIVLRPLRRYHLMVYAVGRKANRGPLPK